MVCHARKGDVYVILLRCRKFIFRVVAFMEVARHYPIKNVLLKIYQRIGHVRSPNNTAEIEKRPGRLSLRARLRGVFLWPVFVFRSSWLIKITLHMRQRLYILRSINSTDVFGHQKWWALFRLATQEMDLLREIAWKQKAKKSRQLLSGGILKRSMGSTCTTYQPNCCRYRVDAREPYSRY